MKRHEEKLSEVQSHTEPENVPEIAEPEHSDILEPLAAMEAPELNDADVSLTDLDEASEDVVDKDVGPPSRKYPLTAIAFWGVILLGAVLRFWGLGDKPLHHDESMHAYYSLQLLYNNIENWGSCAKGIISCYTYSPVLHGPFQFHAIAFVYLIAQWLHAPDHGVNDFTARIVAATLGTLMVALPYFLRDYLGKLGAWLASFLMAISPSLVYFSHFTREAIYMAFFTLLLVVATGRYVRDRKMRWLVWGAAAFSLSYATAEATFLTIAIFGSFLGAIIAWELGKRRPLRVHIGTESPLRKYLPASWGLLAVVLYFLIFLPIAKIGLGILNTLSDYINNPTNTPNADLFVQNLKNNTVTVVPWIGIVLGIYVLSVLIREMVGKMPIVAGRRGLAKRVDPQQQPLLDTILTMSWTHWFFALMCGWAIFLLLFTALFTNIRGGIGDGIWQGLYYWLQQQGLARGGQPWYYYLMLIPLYEQVGVVFGIVGIIRCLRRPTPFRLFLVYWCVGTLFIYSWAAEKMPWLMIHVTMPLMLLAAIGLEPGLLMVWNWIKDWVQHRQTSSTQSSAPKLAIPSLARLTRRSIVAYASVLSVVLAVLLLLPTIHNMYEVNYVHAADGPHEMMVYVQTTTDIDVEMAKITALDQKMDHGQHTLSIGIMNHAGWPFYWYLRDYTNVCYSFPTGCAQNNPVVIIGTQEDDTSAYYNQQYLSHQYKLRSWWDEGYKPAPCIPTKANHECAGQQGGGGIGLGIWLSYGDNPPPGATFNPGLAIKNIWGWWWQRRAFGNTDGAYYMTMFVQKGLSVAP
ncbi:MAG: TIGR03663 family protein [Ktedonobacteraceae bacterium]|nr:TIGR03663 family protein [Ktedonobacteraceae bacterium]